VRRSRRTIKISAALKGGAPRIELRPRSTRYHYAMPLTAEYVLSELEKHADVLRGFGVKRIGIFGSVARGEAREDSDLDLLVDLERHTFKDYMGALLFLEELFGCKVDLVMREALRPELQQYVMPEVIYAANL
jgi:uncharacterized protein